MTKTSNYSALAKARLLPNNCTPFVQEVIGKETCDTISVFNLYKPYTGSQLWDIKKICLQ